MRWMSCTLALACLWVAGCSPEDVPGCRTDLDCREDRICVANICQDPGALADPNVNNGRAGEDPTDDRLPDSNNSAEPELDTGLDAEQGGQDADPAPEDLPSEPDLDGEGDPIVDMGPDLPGDDLGGGPDMDPAPDMAPEPDQGPTPDMPEALPALSVDPAAVDFGRVGLFATESRLVTLRNSGQAPLEITAVALEVEPSQGFQVVEPALPLLLEPGASQQVELRFQPLTLQFGRDTSYANVLLIDSADPQAPTTRVPLSGVGVASPEQCLSFATRELDFGAPYVGDRVDQRVSLYNCGTEPVELEALELEGDTQGVSLEDAPDLGDTLWPGRRAEITLRYQPTGLEPLRGLLRARGQQAEGFVSLLGQPQPQPAASVTLTWDNQADLDLHLARSQEGGFSPFGTRRELESGDCYFANLETAWGCSHLGDDTNGRGPERVVLQSLEQGRRYRVGVNFAQRNGAREVDAELRVRTSEQERRYEAEWDETLYWLPVVIEADGTLTEIDEFQNF